MARRMRFRAWCNKDPEDERKINYRFMDSDGNVQKFTSEDIVSPTMILRIGKAWINTVFLYNNEWYADLYED